MTRSAVQPKGHTKPFVCDMPAWLLKKYPGLTKGARSLYGTMRAIGNGKTGELSIRGNPIDWTYICRQAEISRSTWHKYLKELVTAGLVSYERERVFVYRDGQKRSVKGRARYFVHRQPKTSKKPMILLRANSCTVEELAPRSTQTLLTPERLDSLVLSFSEKGVEGEKKSSSTPKRDDDFSPAPPNSNSEKPKTNPLPVEKDEDVRTVFFAAMLRRLRRAHSDLYARHRGALEHPAFVEAAYAFIDERREMVGTEHLAVPEAYYAKAFANLFEGDGLDLEEVIADANARMKGKTAPRWQFSEAFKRAMATE